MSCIKNILGLESDQVNMHNCVSWGGAAVRLTSHSEPSAILGRHPMWVSPLGAMAYGPALTPLTEAPRSRPPGLLGGHLLIPSPWGAPSAQLPFRPYPADYMLSTQLTHHLSCPLGRLYMRKAPEHRSVERYLATAEPAFPQLLAGLPSLQLIGQSPDTITKASSTGPQLQIWSPRLGSKSRRRACARVVRSLHDMIVGWIRSCALRHPNIDALHTNTGAEGLSADQSLPAFAF